MASRAADTDTIGLAVLARLKRPQKLKGCHVVSFQPMGAGAYSLSDSTLRFSD